MTRTDLALALLFSVLFAGKALAVRPANLSAILSHGESFDSSEILVSGYVCNNEFSKQGLFLTPDDCRASNYDNAIRISFAEKLKRPPAGLVRLRGFFSFKANVIKTDDPYTWGELKVYAVY